jgi:hypothetical protein
VVRRARLPAHLRREMRRIRRVGRRHRAAARSLH